MNKQTTFFCGESIPPFLHVLHLERAYFQPISIIILICTLYIFPHGTWIYYILFITWSILLHSLYTLYVCRVWRTLPDYLMNIFIIKKLCNLNLIKRLLCHLSDICYKCHTWNSKFYLLFGSSYNFTPIKKCGSKKHVQPIKNCWNKIIYSDVPRLLKCINKD